MRLGALPSIGKAAKARHGARAGCLPANLPYPYSLPILKQEDEEMDSWVLATFLVLTIYMLVHSGAAYVRRELKQKRRLQRQEQQQGRR